MKLPGVLKIVIAALLLVSLCGCLNAEERQAARSLKWNYSDDFKARAKEIYGEDARVSNIRADISKDSGGVWPSLTSSTTGWLVGDISVGGESFEAVYGPKSQALLSQRNAGKIKDSIRELFAPLELDIVDLQVIDNGYDVHYLPEEIDSFDKLLEEDYYAIVHVFVRNSLTGLEWEDFEALRSSYGKGRVVLVQLEEYPEEIGSLDFKHMREISFEYKSDRVYSREDKTYVNAYEYYGIKSAIYLQGKRMFYHDQATVREHLENRGW